MLIALPNPDGSFTCTLFFPMKGELSFESLNSSKKAKEFMSQNFGDALELMEDFENQWKHISAVCDGQSMMLYLDGDLVASDSFSGDNINNSDGYFVIGSYKGGNGIIYNEEALCWLICFNNRDR